MFNCLSRIQKQEGFLSLWRGVLPEIIRYFPTQALNFALKDWISGVFKVKNNSSYMKKFLASIAAGGAAGGISLLIVYPLDFAATNMMFDGRYTGLYNVLATTAAKSGVFVWYRGLPISVFAIVLYRGLYFG